MQFYESEDLATIGYGPDGRLAGALLFQDTGSADWIKEDHKQDEYQNQIVAQYLEKHPLATEDEIIHVRNQAFNRWRRLEKGKNTVAFIKKGRIHFYDNEAAYYNSEIGQSEDLDYGKAYHFFGDTYRITLDKDGKVLVTETVRDNGRKRVLTFPANIGNACQKLRDPNSFYWAQIPWLDDIRVEVT